jgi:hypothetical protein
MPRFDGPKLLPPTHAPPFPIPHAPAPAPLGHEPQQQNRRPPRAALLGGFPAVLPEEWWGKGNTTRARVRQIIPKHASLWQNPAGTCILDGLVPMMLHPRTSFSSSARSRSRSSRARAAAAKSKGAPACIERERGGAVLPGGVLAPEMRNKRFKTLPLEIETEVWTWGLHSHPSSAEHRRRETSGARGGRHRFGNPPSLIAGRP